MGDTAGDGTEHLCANAETCASWRRIAASLDKQVRTHHRALFGYLDDDELLYIPGLMQKMAETDVSLKEISQKIEGVPETVHLARSIRKWGAWTGSVIIVLLLAVVTHQYDLVTAITRAVTTFGR